MPAVLDPPIRTAPSAAASWCVTTPLLLLLFIATAAYLHFYDQQHTPIHNDLIGRQFATRAVLHGVSPYSPEMKRQIQAVAGHDPGQGFDYPILLAVLLAPLANLPWPILRLGFLVFVIPALFASFLLCIRLAQWRVPRKQAIAIALVCLCSWPVVLGLRMQQPTLLVAVLALPACWLLSHDREVLPGILLALSTFKPQVVLPLILWLLVWSALRRRWTFPLAFAVTELLFLLCGEWLLPGWFPQWLGTLHQYRALGNVAPLDLYVGRFVGNLATGVIVTGAMLRLWRLRRCAPESVEFAQATALLLAATLCVTPVIWAMIYNQVLLIPACLLLLCSPRPNDARLGGALSGSAASNLSRAVIVWTFVSVPVAALGEWLCPSSVWMSMPFLGHMLAPCLVLALLTTLSAPRPGQALLFSPGASSVRRPPP